MRPGLSEIAAHGVVVSAASTKQPIISVQMESRHTVEKSDCVVVHLAWKLVPMRPDSPNTLKTVSSAMPL